MKLGIKLIQAFIKNPRNIHNEKISLKCIKKIPMWKKRRLVFCHIGQCAAGKERRDHQKTNWPLLFEDY